VENTVDSPPFLLERPLNELAGRALRKRCPFARALIALAPLARTARCGRLLWRYTRSTFVMDIATGRLLFHFRNMTIHFQFI
jgi:hypothetical protein